MPNAMLYYNQKEGNKPMDKKRRKIMKNFSIIARDSKTGSIKTYNYMDETIAYAKFVDVVNSSLWNDVVLTDNRTGEVIDEDHIPDIF